MTIPQSVEEFLEMEVNCIGTKIGEMILHNGEELREIPEFIDALTTYGNARYEEGVKAERQFILNILDGIDIADGECNTKAIRHALSTRVV